MYEFACNLVEGILVSSRLYIKVQDEAIPAMLFSTIFYLLKSEIFLLIWMQTGA